MPQNLIAYVRQDCHLCSDFLRALNKYQAKWDFELKVIDVDGDSQLAARYGHKIPVLEADGKELCHYFLDEVRLSTYFGDS